MLAKEVPIYNTKKNQISSLGSVQSCPICSVAPMQKSMKMRLVEKFPDKRLFLVYIQPRSSTFCCRRESLIRTEAITYILKNFTYSFTSILKQPNLKPQTHGLFHYFNMLPAKVNDDVSQDSVWNIRWKLENGKNHCQKIYIYIYNFDLLTKGFFNKTNA